MTRKEQVKILDDKIKANERQYDLDRTKQLVKNLYKNKQITKQVYNTLNKAITYVQSTNVYGIYKK